MSMALNHGINTYKSDTNFSSVVEGSVSIPFFIGCWPVYIAEGYVGKPQLINGFDEAKKIGGYSDTWRDESGKPKWSLCQAMYSHFKIFRMAPAVFYNVFDPSVHKTEVSATSINVSEHTVKLPFDAINDENLIVTDTENTLINNTDYEVFYDDENCIIELLPDSTHYSDTVLTIGYNKADLSAITAQTIESAVEKIEECKARFGIVPDLICCPGWSQNPAVAAVMASKAGSINGLFKGKAVVDLDTSTSGADTYDDVLQYKTKNGYTDKNMIVCWPLIAVGNHIFDYSVLLCGHMASIDANNDNIPYESPSNKLIAISGCCDANGNEIILSIQQADIVSISAGVVTAINYDGWRVWGNYTGCHPGNTDVAKYFICTNRMMDFICNNFVNTYWSYIDKSVTRVLIDAIVNSFNAYLAGLTADGKLYGGKIQYVEDNNSATDIIAGKFRLDTIMASPVPAQQLDMFVEFDVALLTDALNS